VALGGAPALAQEEEAPPCAGAVVLGGPGAAAPCSPCYLTPPAVALRSLSGEEQRLLRDGEISAGQHAGGVLAAAYLGFGIGHMIEGRWRERGWIFTVGEPLAIAMLIDGLTSSMTGVCVEDPDHLHGCSHGAYSRNAKWEIAGGLVALMALRTWEIVDSYTGPVEHNRKVRQLRALTGQQPYAVRLAPYLAPTGDGAGGLAGVAARF
jgi:hypothetical protein